MAYTANTGRTHFTHRAAVVAASSRSCATSCGSSPSIPPQRASTAAWPSTTGRRASRFSLPAKGADTPAWASRSTRPSRLSAALDRCAELLRCHLDRPLLSLLDPQAGAVLDQTGYTQPVMFALEFALAELWRSWGVEPTAVLGHSVGEFAAACVAGVFSLEDGLRLIAQRARLMQSLPPGGVMAAVFAAEAQVAAALEPYAGRLTIAAINGPQSIVISGDEPAVREVLARLDLRGRQVQAAGDLARVPFAPHGPDPGAAAAGGCLGGLFDRRDRHRLAISPARLADRTRMPIRNIGAVMPGRRCSSPKA